MLIVIAALKCRSAPWFSKHLLLLRRQKQPSRQSPKSRASAAIAVAIRHADPRNHSPNRIYANRADRLGTNIHLAVMAVLAAEKANPRGKPALHGPKPAMKYHARDRSFAKATDTMNAQARMKKRSGRTRVHDKLQMAVR